MNELKFRAWHKELKKYFTISTIDFSKKTVRLGVDFYGQFYSPSFTRVSFDNIILEQMVYNNDNVELYEGDIVNGLSINPKDARVITKKFHRNKTIFESHLIYGVDLSYFFKIKGNIHENGDLLQ